MKTLDAEGLRLHLLDYIERRGLSKTFIADRAIRQDGSRGIKPHTLYRALASTTETGVGTIAAALRGQGFRVDPVYRVSGGPTLRRRIHS